MNCSAESVASWCNL